jgi:hypothetical protein
VDAVRPPEQIGPLAERIDPLARQAVLGQE